MDDENDDSTEWATLHAAEQGSLEAHAELRRRFLADPHGDAEAQAWAHARIAAGERIESTRTHNDIRGRWRKALGYAGGRTRADEYRDTARVLLEFDGPPLTERALARAVAAHHHPGLRGAEREKAVERVRKLVGDLCH